MTYKFPEIKHLNDVYDAIDIKCFYLVQKDGYQIINYMFSSPEAFPPISSNIDIIKREFRGLKFDLEGNLICRPWHKFFNVGERAETSLENIDVSKNHIILEKLDGSMIAPFMVDHGIIWGTKMGKTEVSDQVVQWLLQSDKLMDYQYFVIDAIQKGYTPIFEWCSNYQRIVLDYPESNLILIGMRHMHTGVYLNYTKLVSAGQHWGIPVVQCTRVFDPIEKLSEQFLEYTRKIQNAEGFVIKFDDGHMYKIKSDWYCELHRVKSEINYERGVVSLLINGGMDDLKSLMPVNDRQRIENYETAFANMLAEKTVHVIHLSKMIAGNKMTRKDYALNIMPTEEKWISNIIFKIWDESNDDVAGVQERIKSFILANCNRNSKFDEMRAHTSIFKNVPEWRPVMFDTDDT